MMDVGTIPTFSKPRIRPRDLCPGASVRIPLTRISLTRSIAFATAALLLSAGAAQAQTMLDSVDDSRSEDQLRADVKEAVERDNDVANTALVFNKTTNEVTHVFCAAHGANGEILGRKVARIPGKGVRYLRASDLSSGADFIGSAACSTRGRVVGSAVFLAPGSMTSLEVIQAAAWDSNSIRFPLIATY